MPTYNLPSETAYNFSEGIHVIFQYVASEIPIFPIVMLFSLMFLIWIGGSALAKKDSGNESFFAWGTVSTFITALVAVVLYMIAGILPLKTVIMFIGIFIIVLIIFFFEKEK